MKKFLVFLCAILTATLLMAGAQAYATLVGVSSSDPGVVYDIDPSTGLATAIVTMAEHTSLVGATFLGGELYGSDVLEATFRTGTIDMGTGAFTDVSDQDGSANWHGLASDESAGLIYSIDIDDSFKLKSLTAAGVVTTIGTGTGIDGRGMAYDDLNDILYATNFGGSLYTVDTTLGTASLIGSMGLDISANRIGLAYDEINQILYANSGDLGSLYTIDVSTGAATLVGTNDAPVIDGLAWIDSTGVPEPTTMLLIVTGLVGLVGFRRKFRM